MRPTQASMHRFLSQDPLSFLEGTSHSRAQDGPSARELLVEQPDLGLRETEKSRFSLNPYFWPSARNDGA